MDMSPNLYPLPLVPTFEFRKANKVMRLAANSFDTNSAFQLHVLGGQKSPPLLAYTVACPTRASLKTLFGFGAQHNSLFASVFENECVADPVGRKAIPNGWISPALCSNLLAASTRGLAEKS